MERRANCVAHLKDTEINKDEIKDLKDTVYGNGHAGIKTDVIVMKTNFIAIANGIKIGSTILGIVQLIVIAIVVYTVNIVKAISLVVK